jgi:hypothetical protein
MQNETLMYILETQTIIMSNSPEQKPLKNQLRTIFLLYGMNLHSATKKSPSCFITVYIIKFLLL